MYIYRLNFFAGFVVAGVAYWGLCRLSPVPACGETWLEVPDEDQDTMMAYDVEESSDIEGAGVMGKNSGIFTAKKETTHVFI